MQNRARSQLDPYAYPRKLGGCFGTSRAVLRRVLASSNTPTGSKPPLRLAAPATDNTGAVYFREFGTFAGDRSRVTRPYVVPVLDVGSTMATLTAIVDCPRCRSRPTVQSAIELRPGVEYLTLRCVSCGLLYDAQVPSRPKKVSASSTRNQS